MDLINSVLNTIFAVLFMPFNHLAPMWGLLVISAITGVGMLFVFKATSDQKGIKRAKNLVKGHFLAIRLYKDEVSLMFNTMKNILFSNAAYMRKSLRPMLFLFLPVGMIMVQLGSRYEYRPLRVGESTLVSLRVTNADIDLMSVELELPKDVVLEVPPVRALELREVTWRMHAQQPGSYKLAFRYGEQKVEKTLYAIDELEPLATRISKNNIEVKFLNPSEGSLPRTSFASLISVKYPGRKFQMFGINVHWLLAFFVTSLIAAFALKGLVGVEV